jgi:hypothetical protein
MGEKYKDEWIETAKDSGREIFEPNGRLMFV